MYHGLTEVLWGDHLILTPQRFFGFRKLWLVDFGQFVQDQALISLCSYHHAQFLLCHYPDPQAASLAP